MKLNSFDYAIAACQSDFEQTVRWIFQAAPTSFVDVGRDSLEKVAAGVFISFSVYHLVGLVNLGIGFAVDYYNGWGEGL